MATRKKRTKRKPTRKKSTRKKTSRRKAVDLSALNYDQLQVVAEEAAKRAGKLREQRLAELKEKWAREAEDLGFTFDEVAGRTRRRRKKKAGKKRPASGGRKAKKSKRRRARGTYANPADPSQTWSGRGRRPNWLQDYLKAGGDLEALRR